ncbi:MAG: outer membrane beta-barrel protein [Bacteroides graminisolvens]
MKRLLAFIICSCAVGSIFSQETDTLTTVPSQQHVTVWQQDETVVAPEKKKTHRLPNQHKVNVGFRAGLNSTMYQVSSLKISGITIDDVQNNYKIGYAGTLFMRFNIRKHFVQPEVSYTISRGEIEFDRLG